MACGGAGLRYRRGSVIEEIAYVANWAFPARAFAHSALALLAASGAPHGMPRPRIWGLVREPSSAQPPMTTPEAGSSVS